MINIDKCELGFDIREAIFSNFKDSDKVRASKFKKIVQKVVNDKKLNMKVVKLSTSWGMWCTCCHPDCDQAYPQRSLHIEFEPEFYLEVHI